MNDYNLCYLASLEKDRNEWRTRYFELMAQCRRLFIAFFIVALITIYAVASLLWMVHNG